MRSSAGISSWWLGLAGVVCGLASLYCGLQAPVNDDDVYHLHGIWLVAHGAVPYREFFEIHPPGLWLLLGPLALLFETPSRYFLAGRIATAIAFGFTVWLAGLTIRARGAQIVVLVLLALSIMDYADIWMFRAESVAILLFMLHACLLAGLSETPRGSPFRSVLAASALALGCTMSVRVLPFLAVQPIVVLSVAAHRWKREALHWGAGLLLGALPAIAYLAAYRLWGDMWFWTFRFVSSTEIATWRLQVTRNDLVLASLGMVSIALSFSARNLVTSRRVVLLATWALALLFHLSNPFKVRFAATALLFTTAMALTTLVLLIARHQSVIRRDAAIVTLAAGLLFFAHRVAWVPIPFDRQTQQMQLLVLDWLRQVAGAEPVVLVAPYHPMTVRDASDLQHAWYYAFWITSAAVKARLRDFGARVLEHPPPVIAADPWTIHTNGMDLVAWLSHAGILSPNQFTAIRAMLAQRYSRVVFPELTAEYAPPFGSQFWVRDDRLRERPPPGPALVGRVPGEGPSDATQLNGEQMTNHQTPPPLAPAP